MNTFMDTYFTNRHNYAEKNFVPQSVSESFKASTIIDFIHKIERLPVPSDESPPKKSIAMST